MSSSLAIFVLDEVRRRVQYGPPGHSGRKNGPLYRCRKLMTLTHERLDRRMASSSIRERADRCRQQPDPEGETGRVPDRKLAPYRTRSLLYAGEPNWSLLNLSPR